MTEIIIYTKDWCGFCRAARQLLRQLGCRFTEIDVTHDQAQFNDMVQRANGRTSVPQIFVDGVGIGGFTDLSALVSAKAFPPTVPD